LCTVSLLCQAGQDAVLRAFLRESMGQYAGPNVLQETDADFEDVLYAWAKADPDRANLQRRVEQRYGVPAALAQSLIQLTLERGALEEEQQRKPALVQRYRDLAKAFPDQPLALIEATRVVDDGSYGSCNIADLQALAASQSDPDAARLIMFDTVWCEPLLTERTQSRNGDTTSYVDLALRSGELRSDILQLAVLRIADTRLRDDTVVAESTRVKIRQQRIMKEVELLRLDEALAALPDSPEQWPALLAALDVTQRRTIAAAYLQQAQPERARAWLRTASEPEPESPDRDYAASQMALRNFQLDLLKRLLEAPERDDFDLLVRHFKWGSSGATTQIWTQLFNTLALAQGYPALVQENFQPDAEQEKRAAIEACYRCAPELIAAIADVAAKALPASLGEAEPEATTVGPALPEPVRQRMQRVLTMPRPLWREQPMPLALRSTAKESASASSPAWSEHLPRGRLIRYEQKGQRIIALTASQTLDPTGEISAGGYWLSVSDDGGKHFAPPLYTGLRMYTPYVVRAQSRLPMLDGDRLQLEVAVRRLDDQHIMLPPVTLPFLEQRDDVYVEVTLAELARDSDGDGLTDLAEWGMLLDPELADTDGDGLNDGEDPLPHIAAADRRPGSDAMAAALNEVFGESLGAIVTTDAKDPDPGRAYAIGADTDAYHADSTRFMAAPPGYFGGLALKQRVVVLDAQQIRAMTQYRGTTFILGISTFAISHDGNKALMRWSTGWAGGTLLLTRKGDAWVSEAIAGWIT